MNVKKNIYYSPSLIQKSFFTSSTFVKLSFKIVFKKHFLNCKRAFTKYENDSTKITVIKYIKKIIVNNCKLSYCKDFPFNFLLTFAKREIYLDETVNK